MSLNIHRRRAEVSAPVSRPPWGRPCGHARHVGTCSACQRAQLSRPQFVGRFELDGHVTTGADRHRLVLAAVAAEGHVDRAADEAPVALSFEVVTAPSAMCRFVTANVRSFRPETALSAIFDVVTVPLATFEVVIALATMSMF